MSKHIHLYIHRARSAGKTTDAGEFDEGKHKRDADGKFATSSGDSNHHLGQSMKHETHAAQKALHKGDKDPEVVAHKMAAQHHFAAAKSLGSAEALHTMAPNVSKSHMEAAEKAAQEAKAHEAKLPSAAPAPAPAAPKQDAPRQHGPTGFPSLGTGQGPGAKQPAAGTRYKPGDQIRQTMPVGGRVRLASSAEEHEIVGHVGAGSNALLQLKSGGTMPVTKAVFLGSGGAGAKPAAAAAPKGFQTGSRGHLEAKAANQWSSNENLGNAKRHLEQQGFIKTHSEGHDIGSGPSAEFQQHIEYAHNDGRTMQIVHATRGRGGSAGGWTQIQDLSKKG